MKIESRPLAILDATRKTSKLYNMKATIDFPDELYRRVKARSAMEGRPVRAVAVQLFQSWLEAPEAPAGQGAPELSESELRAHPWLAIVKPYLKPGMSHDLAAIRMASARGWGDEVAGKLADPSPER